VVDEDAVAKQGLKVRELKAAKADKAVIKAEVEILLALKAGKSTPASAAKSTAKPAAKSAAKVAPKPAADVPAGMAEFVERATKAEKRLADLSQAFEKYVIKGGTDAAELSRLKIENVQLQADNAKLRRLLQEKHANAAASTATTTTPATATATKNNKKNNGKAPKATDNKAVAKWSAGVVKACEKLVPNPKTLADTLKDRPTGWPGTHWLMLAANKLATMAPNEVVELAKAVKKSSKMNAGDSEARAFKYIFASYPLP